MTEEVVDRAASETELAVEVGAGQGCSRKSTLMRPWLEDIVVGWG